MGFWRELLPCKMLPVRCGLNYTLREADVCSEPVGNFRGWFRRFLGREPSITEMLGTYPRKLCHFIA